MKKFFFQSGNFLNRWGSLSSLLGSTAQGEPPPEDDENPKQSPSTNATRDASATPAKDLTSTQPGASRESPPPQTEASEESSETSPENTTAAIAYLKAVFKYRKKAGLSLPENIEIQHFDLLHQTYSLGKSTNLDDDQRDKVKTILEWINSKDNEKLKERINISIIGTADAVKFNLKKRGRTFDNYYRVMCGEAEKILKANISTITGNSLFTSNKPLIGKMAVITDATAWNTFAKENSKALSSAEGPLKFILAYQRLQDLGGLVDSDKANQYIDIRTQKSGKQHRTSSALELKTVEPTFPGEGEDVIHEVLPDGQLQVRFSDRSIKNYNVTLPEGVKIEEEWYGDGNNPDNCFSVYKKDAYIGGIDVDKKSKKLEPGKRLQNKTTISNMEDPEVNDGGTVSGNFTIEEKAEWDDNEHDLGNNDGKEILEGGTPLTVTSKTGNHDSQKYTIKKAPGLTEKLNIELMIREEKGKIKNYLDLKDDKNNPLAWIAVDPDRNTVAFGKAENVNDTYKAELNTSNGTITISKTATDQPAAPPEPAGAGEPSRRNPSPRGPVKVTNTATLTTVQTPERIATPPNKSAEKRAPSPPGPVTVIRTAVLTPPIPRRTATPPNKSAEKRAPSPPGAVTTTATPPPPEPAQSTAPGTSNSGTASIPPPRKRTNPSPHPRTPCKRTPTRNHIRKPLSLHRR